MFNKTKHHIFITCTPKSGSTYLLRLLESLLGYEVRIFIAAFDRTEQDLFEPKIINNLNINTVSHQHTRCTDNNIRLLKKHHIKPVVLTRNLFDSVISMRNHMLQEPENSWWPMGYVDHNFYDLPIERQYDFVIDLLLPWYINFYVSWQRYAQKEELLWITYEKLFSAKEETLQEVLQYYGIKKKVTLKDIEKHEKKIEGKTRKTQTKIAKETVLLTEIQKEKIKRLAQYYPDVDFGKLGL
ncbi:MAG: sulfotransferase domain-containing protein [Flavobacteriaceae bacterium]